ncbi:RNA-binding S4 domain-containing protein [Azohydromonas lata]|uniref:RNA-binding S4 domain-containing protein n=1 Tax=Azohydromonas lata TaxID=45677 RepID=A0ABU5IK30_9BURK|nr:RNA-binding S4 domain-containing protein [Azohydromonas lata]MDZ5459229.1 RNA-binding S4 domain-containing protein [Azohydromonas lata]
MIELPLQERVRLDKWLWAARFFKTRGLASEEIGKNRISVNGQVAKASRELKAGDRVSWRQQGVLREVEVRALSEVRGPAPLAQALYAETPESLEARRVAAEQRRQGIEPAQSIVNGRPTKRDRRDIEREQRQRVEWDRWSAKLRD